MLALVLFTASSSCFYLPGVSPRAYKKGDSVALYVNALSAEDSLIPYDYYHEEFHFCRPQGEPVPQRESLGSILFGDRLFNSPFTINALEEQKCVKLCGPVSIPPEDSSFIYERIVEEYSNNWMIGNST